MIKVIPNIKGVYSNADSEDLSDEFARTLKNYISRTGKIEKTFDFGTKFQYDVLEPIDTGNWVDTDTEWEDEKYWIDDGSSVDTDIGETITNLLTYFHPELATPYGSGDRYCIIAINYTNNVFDYLYFNGSSWNSSHSLTGTRNIPYGSFPSIYQKNEVNPVIQSNGILRIFPGNEAKPDGSHVGGVVWIGYIGRDYFDETYSPGDDVYYSAAGFFITEVDIATPDLSTSGLNPTTQLRGGAVFNTDGQGETKYYKLSYLYDGINESLLSSEIKIEYTENTFLRLVLTMDTSTFNKRITGINLYRSSIGEASETATSRGGSFYKISSIDFTRKAVDYESDSNWYGGYRYFYIPGGFTAPSAGQYYYLRVYSGTDWEVYDLGTTYPTGNILHTAVVSGSAYEYQIDVKYWDKRWELHESPVKNAVLGTGTLVDDDTDGGCYGGVDQTTDESVIILGGEPDLGLGNYGESIVQLSTTGFYIVSNSYKSVIDISAEVTTESSTATWKLLKPSDGLYTCVHDSGTVTITIFDSGLDDGTAFPLLNEPSIEVFGEYALYHRGRLWQFNIVLDPSDKAEVRPDWLSYSELEQPDVNPVSNVIRVNDHLGGEGTGLATSFGSLVLFKEHSIFKLIISDPSDTSTWELTDSIFSRGNIAKLGLVQVGHVVYFCSYDGIYELDVNFQAAADDSPLIQNRISEPINDKYLALDDITEKPNVIGKYDQINTEVVFQLEENSIWAYNIVDKTWRERDSAINMDVVAYDENGNLMVCDNTNQKLYSASVNGNCGCHIVTKVFPIRSGNIGETLGLLRYVKIRYKSAVALTVNIYCDDNYSSARATGTLPITSTIDTAGIAVRYWCHNFAVEIKDATSNGNATEIYEISYEAI